MHLEVFSEGRSIIHRLDPRVKLLCYGVFAFSVALVDDLRVPFNAFLLSLAGLGLARLNLWEVTKRVFVVNLLLLPLWVLVPMDTPGSMEIALGPYRATAEGIRGVLVITLKANAIVLGGIVMLGTSDLFSLAHGLAHLRVPGKLVFVFFIFLRYLTLIHDEYNRLKRAALARAFRPGTNLRTYRAYAYLFGMLFVRSYERAERLLWAMKSRNFRGEFPLYRHFHLQRADIMAVLVFTIIMAGLFLA